MAKEFDLQKRRSIKKANTTTQVTNNLLNVYDDDVEELDEPRETKTERLFILITPTLNKQLKRTAKRLNTSKNALVNEALERYLNNLNSK